MGWTSYHATHYKKNGTIDRKAECDAYFMDGLNAGHYRVVKSALVGSVYYAAIETLKKYGERQPDGSRPYVDIPETERETWAAVFLTSTDSRDYFNFSYKDMSEDMGPCEIDCPASILSLLSPTNSEYALAWRERCRENIEKKKDPHALKNLPVGSVITFVRFDGKHIELVKHPAAYQFKRPFWYNGENNSYMPANRIPANYEVVTA